MELGHQAKILGFLRRQDLAHEHERSGTVQPQQQRVNDVEAVAGNLARDIEMAGILEGRVLGRNDDVAHQRQLGMTHGRPVDDADHRDLDIQHPCHDPFRVPVGPVEQVGGDVARYLAVERPPGSAFGPLKALPVPVNMMLRFSRSAPIWVKASTSSACTVGPHSTGPPSVWIAICRIPSRRSNFTVSYLSA
jgi:hypothetical protein